MRTEREHVAARIAKRVHGARTGRAWTFDELASRSGVSRRLLVQVERGEANPSLATLLKLAGALGVTLTDLVRQDGESPPFAVVAREDALDLWTTPEGVTRDCSSATARSSSGRGRCNPATAETAKRTDPGRSSS